jgi:CheY-like chemotaxis protein
VEKNTMNPHGAPGSSDLEPSRRVDVLLADDDEDIRDALTDTLEYAGYSTLAFSNGQDALEWLQGTASLPSLILVDMTMPVLDGVQFCEQHRGDPTISSVPLAILSARNDVLRGLGVEHLMKPISADELISFVARHCGARAAQG